MWRGNDAGDWYCGLGEALQSELGVVVVVVAVVVVVVCVCVGGVR
jgi:hypothetical protein